MPDSTKTEVIVAQHEKTLNDHEARLRIQERWATDHDAWVKSRWGQQDQLNARLILLIERGQDKADVQAKELSHAYAEIGKMKVRMGFVMALAGSVGGIVTTVLGSLVLWALGVFG